jgi:hypothetical protein
VLEQQAKAAVDACCRNWRLDGIGSLLRLSRYPRRL